MDRGLPHPPPARRHSAAAPLKFSVPEMGNMQKAKSVKVALRSGQARDTGPRGGRYGAGSIPQARQGEDH